MRRKKRWIICNEINQSWNNQDLKLQEAQEILTEGGEMSQSQWNCGSQQFLFRGPSQYHRITSGLIPTVHYRI